MRPERVEGPGEAIEADGEAVVDADDYEDKADEEKEIDEMVSRSLTMDPLEVVDDEPDDIHVADMGMGFDEQRAWSTLRKKNDRDQAKILEELGSECGDDVVVTKILEADMVEPNSPVENDDVDDASHRVGRISVVVDVRAKLHVWATEVLRVLSMFDEVRRLPHYPEANLTVSLVNRRHQNRQIRMV